MRPSFSDDVEDSEALKGSTTTKDVVDEDAAILEVRDEEVGRKEDAEGGGKRLKVGHIGPFMISSLPGPELLLYITLLSSP
ncbi:hypothetical protein D9756_004373 [Leucocoprinus leucothites]|uniref:Uncharacterized protein n=1 Tax=Leucocoprinus leucothites TaxID=201217 RepID=A0A8H5G0Q5_9AGAR|nr:hypothetical protein D9756_004373 [Leucoagaricus leucothites]